MAASRLWDRQGGHEDRTVHLIGAAGSGMRSLARVLHQRGWVLTGSDADARAVDRLRKAAGSPFARLFAWHDAENLPPECGLVIASDAIGRDNPERLVAQRRGLPVLSYTDALGRLMQGDTRGLAVAGTHGKSTTTAMAAHVLIASGKDPTVVCGAATLGQLDGGRAGRGQSVLIEACEYRANFLKLHPRHAVLLGIEPDHFDCYPTLASLEAAFAQFVGQLPPDGLLLARADCPVTRRILTRETPCPVETFA
ncbi:MAG: hypothetical protein JW818_19085, partial [Pirellulales bacterium]|nr:hypothetical protein [Pirellulales bacterium]